jgi:hypothetical protein
MFRNDQQTAAVCDALTRWMRKGRLWDSGGLTAAGECLVETSGVLSSGERLILAFALSVWNPFDNRGPRTDELLASLDPPRMRLVATLLLATAEGGSGAAVDRWLEKNDPSAVKW